MALKMKNPKIFILTGVLAVITLAATAFINLKPSAKKSAVAGKGFAVIELFTSEGCSSCPPADELVAKIQKEYSNQPVYILAFHVDYWNRLGWKDVFSNADYSKRQQDYARYIHPSGGVYTPQIVFNGTKEFIGSEEGTLRNAIKTGLQKNMSTNITLNELKADQHKITIHYQVEGNEKNSVLLLALVQRTAQTNVKAGENKGRNLSHVQIVRALQSVTLGNNKSGTESIALPNGVNAQNTEIIGLLQNSATGEITGAAKAGVAATS
jgi:hypothetical protein